MNSSARGKKNLLRNVTRDDVAKLAGVSVATVSYVFNSGPRQVAPATRARVLQAIEKLGYQPSAVARSLKMKQTLTVGLIVTDILNPFHSGVAKSVEEAARAAGYTLILCNSDEDSEQELRYLRMLESKRVDGIVLVPTGGNVKYLNSLIKRGWNIVLLDRKLPALQVDSVLMDNEQGAYEAVTHLIGLGHRRIALINMSGGLSPGLERRQGYERALAAGGIPADPTLMCEGDFKAETGLDLARRLFELASPPTAIFAGNNRLALDVIRVLRQRNLSMPDDVALCVFDDFEYYSVVMPTITAVGYSIRDLGQKGFELLLEQMSGQRAHDHPKHERVPCRLVVRESTAGRKECSSGTGS